MLTVVYLNLENLFHILQVCFLITELTHHRHQCSINLKDNCLSIITSYGVTPFLAETDIPKRQSVEQAEDLTRQQEQPENSNASSEQTVGLVLFKRFINSKIYKLK